MFSYPELFFVVAAFFKISIKLRIILLLSVKNCAGVLMGIVLNLDCFWKDFHFYYISSTDLWVWVSVSIPWEISPFSLIFFSFYLQRLDDFFIQVFHLPKETHRYLRILSNMMFPNFFLSPQSVRQLHIGGLCAFVFVFESKMFPSTFVKVYNKRRSSSVKFFKAFIDPYPVLLFYHQ